MPRRQFPINRGSHPQPPLYPQQDATLKDAKLPGPLTLHAFGDVPLSLERDETAAGAYELLAIRRNDVTLGYLGIDIHDQIVLYGPDGATALLTATAAGVQAATYRDANGHKVVGTQGVAIADAAETTGSPSGTGSTGGSAGDPATKGDVDAVWSAVNTLDASAANALGTAQAALSKLNEVLAMLRTHGLIATS